MTYKTDLTQEEIVYYTSSTGMVEVRNGEGGTHLLLPYAEWKELTTAKYREL